MPLPKQVFGVPVKSSRCHFYWTMLSDSWNCRTGDLEVNCCNTILVWAGAGEAYFEMEEFDFKGTILQSCCSISLLYDDEILKNIYLCFRLWQLTQKTVYWGLICWCDFGPLCVFKVIIWVTYFYKGEIKYWKNKKKGEDSQTWSACMYESEWVSLWNCFIIRMVRYIQSAV